MIPLRVDSNGQKDLKIPLRVDSNDQIDLKIRELFVSGGGGGDAIVKTNTTEIWNSNPTYVPARGEVDVYTDYETTTDEHGNIINIPAIKIGDGRTYGVDLPFVGDDIRTMLMMHISDDDSHVSASDRLFWNNKLNVTDNQEVVDNILIFNRD